MTCCKICNKAYQQITATHLKHHNITVNEYKIMFPGSPILAAEIKEKLSNHCKKLQDRENFGFKKDHKINKNREPFNKGETKHTNAHVLKYSEKLTGRELSYEHKKNLSISRKKGISNGTIKALKGPANGMFGKKLTESHIKALHKSWRNKKTRPESMMEYMCTQYGFEYTGDRSYKIRFLDGRLKYPDFIMPSMKIAIEVFGDYWHRGEDINELIKKYDEVGWKCLVVWESDLNKGKIRPETIEEFLDIFEIEPFTIEDFSGRWMN